MSITQFKDTSYVSLDESAPVALPLGEPGPLNAIADVPGGRVGLKPELLLQALVATGWRRAK